MTNSTNGAIGVIAAVQRDHKEIEGLLQGVASSAGAARQDAFEDLVRKLAVHETAEEEVVHPLTKQIGADAVADEVLNEENTAKQALSQFDDLDVMSPEFQTAFDKLKNDVMTHAQHEEQNEHPRILESVPADKLERLEKVFDMAEKTAPTRPHPAAGESRAANLAIGPILAVSDRVRDAIRSATDKD